MRGQFIMSEKERIRKGILAKVEGKHIGLKEAAKQMKVSYRQAKRIWKRYREEGDEGLLHRNRGNKEVGHGFEEKWKAEVLERCQKRYEGFGPTLAAEKLEEEGYQVSRETLRKWLLFASSEGTSRKESWGLSRSFCERVKVTRHPNG